MDIKVGQWVKGTHEFINDIPRIRFIKVDKITDICGRPHYKGKHKDGYSNNNMYIRKEDVIKVKDTPQELVEKGNLVALYHHPNYIKQVLDVSGELINFNSSRCLLKDVSKILTPNSNGGYYLQWVGCREDGN